MDFDLRLVLIPKEKEHSHSNSELLYVIRGECMVFLEDNRKQFIKKEDMLYIHSGDMHRIVGKTDDTFVAKLIFSPEVSSRLNGVEFCSVDSKDESILDAIRTRFMKILWEEQSGIGKDSFHRSSLCYEILHLLETYFKDPVDKDDIVRQIRSYLYQHYSEDISLQNLADEFHFSSAYLSRMFKKKFGQNFINYLNQLRLEQATEKIINTDASITTIALKHGFSSISSFYKLFKEVYGVQPTDYRKKYNEEREKHEEADAAAKKSQYLKEHLKLLKAEETPDAGDECQVDVDIRKILCSNTDMNSLINIGPLSTCSDVTFSHDIIKERSEIDMKIFRVWNVIPEEIYQREVDNTDFILLDQFLKFCLKEGMIPYIEIGRPKNSQIKQMLQQDKLKENFIRALDMLVWHVAANYNNYLPIYFELRMFEYEEGYPNKRDYFEIYNYFKKQVGSYMQNVKIGGSGVELLDHIGREAEIITPWAIEEICPDFLSIKLHPYTLNAKNNRRPVADPYCIRKSLARLKKAMRMLDLDNIPIHANYADSFYHKRCYLNDSLWKACYMLKVYRECLGYVKYLAFGRWVDGIEGLKNTQHVVTGGNGMVLRNGVPKPVCILLRTMRGIGTQVICSEPGCIVTKISDHRLRIILYNYSHLNYLFYTNDAVDMDINDTELYLDRLKNKTFHVELTGMEDHRYHVRQFSFNKERCSILDAWIHKGGNAANDDGRWLEFYTLPDVTNSYANCTDGRLNLDFVLNPLEIKGVEIMYDVENSVK